MDEIIKCQLYNIKSILKDEIKIKRTTIINILRMLLFRLCLIITCIYIFRTFEILLLDIIILIILVYQIATFGKEISQAYNRIKLWSYKVPNLDNIEDLYLSISDESYKVNACNYYWIILLYVNGEINERTMDVEILKLNRLNIPITY